MGLFLQETLKDFFDGKNHGRNPWENPISSQRIRIKTTMPQC